MTRAVPPVAVTVLPWLSASLAGVTLGSMCSEMRHYVRDHDGTDGTPVSHVWNRGRTDVLDDVAPWLIICSTATIFGPKGGKDLLDFLRTRHGGMVSVVHAAWHLHCIHRDVLRHVGEFDTFDHAYCEDSDFLWRHDLSGLGEVRKGDGNVFVDVNVRFRENAHSIKLGLADPDMPHRAAQAYALKWGAFPGHEEWFHPFNDQRRDWRWLARDQRALA